MRKGRCLTLTRPLSIVGRGVTRVLRSENPKYKVGDHVLGFVRQCLFSAPKNPKRYIDI